MPQLERNEAQLAVLISSVAWTDQYAKRLIETKEQMQNTLLDCAAGNAAHPALAAAYCAGFIRAIEWALRWPQEQLDEAVARVEEEKRLAEREIEYETRARNGYTYPYVEPQDARAE